MCGGMYGIASSSARESRRDLNNSEEVGRFHESWRCSLVVESRPLSSSCRSPNWLKLDEIGFKKQYARLVLRSALNARPCKIRLRWSRKLRRCTWKLSSGPPKPETVRIETWGQQILETPTELSPDSPSTSPGC